MQTVNDSATSPPARPETSVELTEMVAGLMPFTGLIGLGEIGIGLWVISGIKPRWCAWTQIALVLTMNSLEAVLAPDLLLWGRANALFAALFCGFTYLHSLRPARLAAS